MRIEFLAVRLCPNCPGQNISVSNNNNGSDEQPARKTQEELSADPPIFISDRYEIKRVIGGGINSAVYEAYDKSLKKSVAIKKLHNTSTSVELIRFQREAKLTSSLTHPNVRSVLDFGLTAENEPYLVLELAQGENVSDYLKQHGQMDVEVALDILIQVAAGLEHAHNRSIIHRDIKPSNVMLVESDERLIAQIVDFGIAKSQTSIQDITAEGVGLGTPLFMSPEQVRNADIDQRSDIYSFGCLMYDMLTGQPPFVGATALDTIKMHSNSPPPALEDKSDQEFSEPLEKIVQKTLAKDPADRYSSIKELSVDLENELHRLQAQRAEISNNETKSELGHNHARYGALKIGGVDGANRTVKRPGTFWILAVIGVIAATIFGVFSFSSYFESVPPPSMTSDPFKSHFESTSNFFVTPEAWTADDHATGADLAKLAAHGSYVQRINLSAAPLIQGDDLKVLQNTNVAFLTYTDHAADEKSLKNIAKIRSLSRLKLGDKKNDVYDAKALALLQDAPNLLEVCFYCINVDDTVLTSIAKCKKLGHIGLESGRGLKTAKWELLKPIKNLVVVNWNDTDLDDASLIRATTLQSLQSIFVRGTNISDAGVSRLTALKKLRNLDITGCTKISPACIKKLEEKGIVVHTHSGRRQRETLEGKGE